MKQCFGTVIPDLTATGSNITWYSDIAFNCQVGTGNSLSTGQTSPGIYTYYVTSTDINGCESPPSNVTLEIYSLPSAPVVTNESVCFGTLIPDLTATGSNITWYSDISLNTQEGTGNNLSTGQTAPGIYTYYVTSTDINGCESISSTASLEIYSLPNSPVANNEVAV